MKKVWIQLGNHLFSGIRLLSALSLIASMVLVNAMASTATIYPDSLKTIYGSASEQSVDVLSVQDQSGNSDGWSSYVEFYTESRGLYSILEFYAPLDFVGADLQEVELTANFKGPMRSEQSWRWHIWDFKSKRWVFLGTNDNSVSWRWIAQRLSLSSSASDYMDPIGRLWVSYSTLSARDNSDLDAVALTLTTTVADSAPAQVVPQVSSQPVEALVASTSTPTPTVVTPAETSSAIWSPRPGTSWQIQYTGTLDTSLNVDMYNIDLFDTPISTINSLKERGIAVICYYSSGSYEDWRPDAGAFPASVKGASNGWAGEAWLDISAIDVLAPIMSARLDMAVEKGCTGVDPDNVDGYANNTGFALTAQQQLDYNIWTAQQAHARGLSIGLKNNLSQVRQLEPYYDWAMNESCNQYSECDYLTPFVDAGKAVFGIEYKGDMGQQCSTTNALNFDFLMKPLNLNASREACR